MPWGVRPSVLPRPATPATPLPLVPTLTLLTLAGGVAAVVSAAQERANYRRTRALLSHPPSSVGGGGGGGGGDGTLAPHPLATASSPASARLCGVGASSDARPDGWRGRRGGDTAAAAPKLLNTHVGGGGRVVSASPAGGVAEKKRGGGWKSIQWDVVSFSSSVLFSWKRLNLACELISAPNLVAVDEGTTGIDSFQALKVVEALRDLAADGHTVLASIHQPQSSIYALFDDLLLLAEGRVVYMGPTAAAHEYFEGLGHGCPPAYNPAEHWIDLVSIDYASPDTEAISRQRVRKLHAAWDAHVAAGKGPAAAAAASAAAAAAAPAANGAEGTPPVGAATTAVAVRPSGASTLTKFRLLFSRAWKQMARDKKTLFARTMSSGMSALLFGSIYWKLGLTQADVGNRLGLLQVACINAAMSALVKTLNSFTRERAVVDRERARGSYGVTPYFASKMVAELPISTAFPLLFSAIVYPMAGLAAGWRKVATFASVITLESFTAAAIGLTMGALAPSTEAALAAGPASFVLFIVFGGQFVTRVPRALQWLPRISLIRHAFEALCVSELGGLKLEKKVPWDVATGEQALARMRFGSRTVPQLLGSQARILAFNYIATFALLRLRKPKFATVLPPATVTEVQDGAPVEGAPEGATA